jgi:hypothetical protein
MGWKVDINLYRYTKNNPLINTDPSGLCLGTYSITTQTLSAFSFITGESITSSPVQSGDVNCSGDPNQVDYPFCGPIPPGGYYMEHSRLRYTAPFFTVIPLTPKKGTVTFDRDSFEIHALRHKSEGCITPDKDTFDKIAELSDRESGSQLVVIP